MNRFIKKMTAVLLMMTMIFSCMSSLTGCLGEDEDVIVLRVSNWEEYIDEGGWEDEEIIDLDENTEIFSKNSMIEEYEEWFYKTYGKKVRVEYSTFGTNEELYNQLTIGDTYDLVCPSEYMIMKMMEEDMLEPYSEEFGDKEIETNYYINGVSSYIKNVYDNLSYSDEVLSKYVAGYMWGTLGIVYNPEVVSREEANHWNILLNDKYAKQITIKDSVRDAYFAGISIYRYDDITKKDFVESDNYYNELTSIINSTDKKSVDEVEKILSRIKDNVYSFETDSGKADLVSGKVVANEQWSGDAVYTMDQAEEEGVFLEYAAPQEATNLWFDGWVMLKNGINNDADKKMAAEAFVNFLSMPENAVRNMYYIGYTSVIAGGDNDIIYKYADWCYGCEEEDVENAEELVEYDVDYFFDFGENETITTTKEQTKRQLYAQYPTIDVVQRSIVMAYFDAEGNERINRMWTNVRCFDIGLWWEKLTK